MTRARKLLFEYQQITPTYVVFDDFNRADNISEIGITASGHTWNHSLEPNTTWGILGKQLYISATAGVHPYIYIDDGLVAKSVSMDVLINWAQARIVFRMIDTSNWFSLNVSAAGMLILSKRVNGVGTTLRTITSAVTPNTICNLRVVDNGNAISVYTNGTLQFTVNQTDLNTATKAGIMIGSTDPTSLKSVRIDNYKVEAI